MVALGIQMAFERSALVLEAAGTTPVRRGDVVRAKILATLAVLVVQVVVIAGVGSALGLAAGPERVAVGGQQYVI